MLTLDRIEIHAPLDRVFACASDVERWPEVLPHYRWVRFLERRNDGGRVEMAAWRPFGPARWPTWWVSEMRIDRAAGEIHYTHVRGVTSGMDVVWRLSPGPRWPGIGALAANVVIGPVFVHGIASRTLAGIKRHLEGAGT
jgi:ribosome-associated toxin RatA of RatAB toxin-antitoxin module